MDFETARPGSWYFDRQEFTKVDRRHYPGIAALLDRGVHRGDSFTRASPRIEVMPATVGGPFLRHSLNELVQREAQRKSRRLQGTPHTLIGSCSSR